MTSEMELYQRKYSLLKRKCEELHQTNEKLVNRIHQVKRILKRYKCERRMLVEELDKHGDDFREAEIPPMYEVAGGCESQDLGDASGLLNSSLQLSEQDQVGIASSSDMVTVDGDTSPSLMSPSLSRPVSLGR